MRPSEIPELQEWARSRIARFRREFPNHANDLEQEALVGLLEAERDQRCPDVADADEFRAFAYAFIRGSLGDYVKKLRTEQRCRVEVETCDDADWTEAIEDKPAPHQCEWLDFRQATAGRLKGARRQVFLETYGEDRHRPLAEVSENTGLSLDYIKHQHAQALEIIRDISHFQRVA
jgi:RNA polymerase sigma factor (sigma-70 family)